MKEKYRPSNGTEGDYFMCKFCYQCFHEKFLHTQNHNDKTCEILSNSMIYDTNDVEYPKEWTYDEAGKAVCTNFKKWDWGRDDGNGLNEPPEPPTNDPNQLVIPFEINTILEQTEKRELIKQME